MCSDSVTIYVLRLENDKYYIGKTRNLEERISDHFSNAGTRWTKQHKPIDILHIIPECKEQDLDKYTLNYMKIYGFENVRGGSFSSLVFDDKRKKMIKHSLPPRHDKCFRCGSNEHFIKNCPDVKSPKSWVIGHYSRQSQKVSDINPIHSNITLNLNISYSLKDGGINKEHEKNKSSDTDETKEINKSNKVKRTNETDEIKKKDGINVINKIDEINEKREKDKICEANKVNEMISITVALSSHHGKWLCFDKKERGYNVVANRDAIKNFEKIELVFMDEDKILLKSKEHGTYLKSEGDGSVSQTLKLEEGTEWMIIFIGKMKKLVDDAYVGFKNIKNGNYLCAEKGFGFLMSGYVVADRSKLGKFETWKIRLIN